MRQRLAIAFVVLVGFACPKASAQVSDFSTVNVWELRELIALAVTRPVLWHESFPNEIRGKFQTIGRPESESSKSYALALEQAQAAGMILVQAGDDPTGPLTLRQPTLGAELAPLAGRLVSLDAILEAEVLGMEHVHCLMPITQLDCQRAYDVAAAWRENEPGLAVTSVPAANALVLAGRATTLKWVIENLLALEEQAAKLPDALKVEDEAKARAAVPGHRSPPFGEKPAYWCLDVFVPFGQCLYWSQVHDLAGFDPRKVAIGVVDWQAGTPDVPSDPPLDSFSRFMQERCLANGYACLFDDESQPPVFSLCEMRVIGSQAELALNFDPKNLDFAKANPAVAMRREFGYGKLPRDESEALVVFLSGGVGVGETSDRRGWDVTMTAAGQLRLLTVLDLIDQATTREAAQVWRQRRQTPR